MNDFTTKTSAEWGGIEDAAGLLAVRIGAWNHCGYVAPESGQAAIPPLGERSADAIKAGHGAIEVIDEILRDLYRLREQLVAELRADEDARAVRVDKLLAESRAELARLRQEREAWEQTARACVCPPGLCSRRDGTPEADPSGCAVCAELSPDQPCHAAVVRGLRAREEAGR